MRILFTLIFIGLLVSLSFSQKAFKQTVDQDPFANSGETTIEQITGIDTVAWRADGGKSVDPTAWTDFTNTITAAEKTTESTQYFSLSNETGWTWYHAIQFNIHQGDSSITSGWTKIGDSQGAITYSVKLDTSGTVTTYTSRLGGN